MVALGAAGVANIPFISLIAVLAPIIIVMIHGNPGKDLRNFLVHAGPFVIPFFAFTLGAGMELGSLFHAGLPGILLGELTTFAGGIFNILSDKAAGGSGIAGAAASSTAENAVATPHALALADPSMSALAASATPLVAASTMTTAILTHLLTWMVRQKKGEGLYLSNKVLPFFMRNLLSSHSKYHSPFDRIFFAYSSIKSIVNCYLSERITI